MTSNPEQRIVVTGLGATTPVGANVAETWEAVLAGTSGVRLLSFDWVETYQLPVKIAATIKQAPVDVMARVEVRRLDPSGQYALIAAREAWADAATPEVEPERLGVVIGTGIGGVSTLLDQWDTLREKGVRRVFPLAVPMLAGPGAISTAIVLQSQAAGVAHSVALCVCIVGVAFVSYLIFRISAHGGRWLSPIATKVLTRIMGLLLAAVAVQFMINGLKGVRSDWLQP